MSVKRARTLGNREATARYLPTHVVVASRLVLIVALVAVATCGLMLLVGVIPLAKIHFAPELCEWARRQNPWFSALPLILGGGAYVALQGVLRPRPIELLKRLMLGTAFLLWGVVQVMPAGDLATELGNLVIALYVIDLAMMIRSDLSKACRR